MFWVYRRFMELLLGHFGPTRGATITHGSPIVYLPLFTVWHKTSATTNEETLLYCDHTPRRSKEIAPRRGQCKVPPYDTGITGEQVVVFRFQQRRATPTTTSSRWRCREGERARGMTSEGGNDAARVGGAADASPSKRKFLRPTKSSSSAETPKGGGGFLSSMRSAISRRIPSSSGGGNDKRAKERSASSTSIESELAAHDAWARSYKKITVGVVNMNEFLEDNREDLKKKLGGGGGGGGRRWWCKLGMCNRL